MTKRKLSQNQTRRIRSKQQAKNEKAIATSETDIESEDHTLGAEQEGRVVAHYGTQVDIEYGDKKTIRCFLRANLAPVITGDRIVWRQGKDKGVVESCQPRKSLLSRPDSYGKLKPVAANVDQIIITVAPEPEFFTNLIDRYLVVAEINNIKPLILINKADLIDETNQSEFDNLQKSYTDLGYRVLTVSAKDSTGLDELIELLKDNTSILVGQSGVGKSSILQTLIPDKDIEIGELSNAKSKGRHTTTHSQLFHFVNGGECIDSPGIREFGLWNLDAADVIAGFVELNDLTGTCKFRDCSHENEPKCALKEALENGTISEQRFTNYKRIIASLDDVQIQSSQ